MLLDKCIAELAFHSIFYQNGYQAKQILSLTGSPEEFFKKPPPEFFMCLPPFIRERFTQLDVKKIEQDYQKIKSQGIRWLTLFDDEYPRILKEIYDPPYLFFYLGNLPNLQEQPSIAVIGSRHSTGYGREVGYELSSELASKGIVVTSGLAFGIDSIAHKAAVDNKAATIAVMGNGIDIIYPACNKGLADKIIKHGAIISEFPIGERPNKYNFPQRNRVISGLSIGVLVIEAAIKSGTAITVGTALGQNREVFAVPGQVGHINAQGTNNLIKKGAKLVEGLGDIYLEIKDLLPQNHPWHLEETKKQELMKNGLEESIGNMLKGGPRFFDEIIAFHNADISAIMAAILDLRCRGLIKELEGKRYCLTSA